MLDPNISLSTSNGVIATLYQLPDPNTFIPMLMAVIATFFASFVVYAGIIFQTLTNKKEKYNDSEINRHIINFIRYYVKIKDFHKTDEEKLLFDTVTEFVESNFWKNETQLDKLIKTFELKKQTAYSIKNEINEIITSLLSIEVVLNKERCYSKYERVITLLKYFFLFLSGLVLIFELSNAYVMFYQTNNYGLLQYLFYFFVFLVP